MSRRGRPSSSKKVASGPPPSHPSESYREHRKFLIRSLERNDVDMNALIELNKSLHEAKETIVKSCGELVLLDLGCGRLKLINDELHQEKKEASGETAWVKTASPEADSSMTPKQIEACVDFLLRMKLRRKLSTRLVRRLTRLSHVMDGKDVYPPSAPKYGDVRLKIDPESLKQWQSDFEKKEEARKRIKDALEPKKELDEEKEEEKASEESKPESEPAGETETEKPKDLPDETTSAEAKGEPKDVAAETGEETEKAEGDEKERGDEAKGDQTDQPPPALADDFKTIKEFDAAFEKTWDDAAKAFRYSLANEDAGDPDYEKLTNGGGIGASSAFFGLDALEAEFKRWQTNLLRKVHEQPTFEELGLKNRVFNLEERRKRCLEETEMEVEGTDTAAESPTKKAKTEAKEDGDDNSDSDEEEVKEEKNTILEEIKPKRSISFAATPSFHDQDLMRIRAVHRDLLTSSQAELTRKRLTDATNEYNKALQLSTQLFDARQLVQHNLTFAIAKGRQELTKAHSDYTIAYTQAKQRWLKEKYAHDMKKSQAVLPSKWGNQPFGTDLIKSYRQINRANIQRVTVGVTVADIVDASIMAAQGKAQIQRFKDFVPPPAPGMNAQTGENMAQRQHRVELEYRQQYTALDAKFQKSETERGRAWRKVMKSQAEINAVTGLTGRGVRITMSNYHQIPLPAIRGASQQTVPTHVYAQPSTRPAYTSPSSGSTTDMSKYSAAKVKMRKSADGTVAPVSQPKKTKDGLYLRPAGRTRKGMQWDAVNGVWVPMQSSS